MKIAVTIGMVVSLLTCYLIREYGMSPDQGGLAVGCLLAGMILGFVITMIATLQYNTEKGEY